MDDLVAYVWDGLIKRFEGFNLTMAQDFAQNFDGTRAKVGDLHLEVTKFSIIEATGISQGGDQWFKNIKIEGVPWHLLMDSKKARCFRKGTSISLFK
jgi:hypothetical protein